MSAPVPETQALRPSHASCDFVGIAASYLMCCILSGAWVSLWFSMLQGIEYVDIRSLGNIPFFTGIAAFLCLPTIAVSRWTMSQRETNSPVSFMVIWSLAGSLTWFAGAMGLRPSVEGFTQMLTATTLPGAAIGWINFKIEKRLIGSQTRC